MADCAAAPALFYGERALSFRDSHPLLWAIPAPAHAPLLTPAPSPRLSPSSSSSRVARVMPGSAADL